MTIGVARLVRHHGPRHLTIEAVDVLLLDGRCDHLLLSFSLCSLLLLEPLLCLCSSSLLLGLCLGLSLLMILGVDLLVLLEILRSLERLFARRERARVRLQRGMDSYVAGDVITFCKRNVY